ncbi:hypothetical protein AHAS_Ahas03G0134400 [Arachis hypogaea]
MNPNSQRQPRALVSLSQLSQLGVGNGQPLTLTSSLSRARPRNPFTLTSSLPSLSVRHSQSLSISPRHALVLSLFSFAVNFLRATRFGEFPLVFLLQFWCCINAL